MTAQPITAVKIGNARSDKTADVSKQGCRTLAQHEAVMAYHREIPSVWWCGNPFEQRYPGQRFRCAFAHTFYDRDGALRSIWVELDGKITSSVAALKGKKDGHALTAATVAKYGLFQGA